MENNTIEANWEILKGKAKQYWGKITDDDWMRVKGKRQELVGKLEERYGYEHERAEMEVDKFLKESESKDSKHSTCC